MEISVEKMKPIIDNDDGYKKNDLYYSYESYTVYIGNHRILNTATSDEITAAKWLTEVLKTNSLNNSQLIAGFSLERKDDQLLICIESQCLIFDLSAHRRPKFLVPFFSDRKLIVVGTQMEQKKSRLEKAFEVKITNAVDLNELAVKVMKKDELDLAKYGLDEVAKVVLGTHVAVNRYVKFGNDDDLVLFATVDAFLTYHTAYELLNKNKKKKGNKNGKKMKKEIDENHAWGLFDCCF